MVIVIARWGRLKKASWLKKIGSVFVFFGEEWRVIRRWSLDTIIPVSVAISADSLIILGIVGNAVFCSTVSLVRVPAKMVMIVSRIRGLIMLLVSLWVLCLVRG